MQPLTKEQCDEIIAEMKSLLGGSWTIDDMAELMIVWLNENTEKEELPRLHSGRGKLAQPKLSFRKWRGCRKED